MPEWNSRLAVSYEEGETTVQITPIQTFSPTFALNAEALHSIEQTHIGVVYTPQAITFTMTVTAIGDVAAQLTTLALEGTTFNVILQETDDGNDWSFSKIVLTDCIITSAAPTNATTSGAPAATFSGFSLAGSSEDKSEAVVTIP